MVGLLRQHGAVDPPWSMSTGQMKRALSEPESGHWIGRTFLHVAAEKGRVDVAEALLRAGADLESIELEHGSTALGCAVRMNQAEMVSFLRQCGADPDAPAGSPWAHARTRAADRLDLLRRLA